MTLEDTRTYALHLFGVFVALFLVVLMFALGKQLIDWAFPRGPLVLDCRDGSAVLRPQDDALHCDRGAVVTSTPLSGGNVSVTCHCPAPVPASHP